jgi:catechol 2,3-dioxygenase-like lactoylglutathione lyase family enzyme
VPIVHVGLTVPDIEHAVRWYEEVLGFVVLCRPVLVTAGDGHAGRCAAEAFGSPFGGMQQAQLLAGNGVGIELFQFIQPVTPIGRTACEYWCTGPFHLCVGADDVARLAARVTAAGGRQRTAVRLVFAGEPYRWCYCEDPFGNILEIYSHGYAQVYANRLVSRSGR